MVRRPVIEADEILRAQGVAVEEYAHGSGGAEEKGFLLRLKFVCLFICLIMCAFVWDACVHVCPQT